MGELLVWRHPRASNIAGRCIGRTDVVADPRKIRRLANRIARYAASYGIAREVWTSPLKRSALVGASLKARGWIHRIDNGLSEIDFGEWDGRAWSTIEWAHVAAWEADFMHARPGGGESLAMLFDRVAACIQRLPAHALIVGHAGWINAARWLSERDDLPTPRTWPRAPRYGALARIHTRREEIPR
ncbi:MAG TPA: histidine phosphatase family protein [Burkholderiaceae bacterium]|nr:histidine phosphatase family protein [Burkholderiaceae bacterium]